VNVMKGFVLQAVCIQPILYFLQAVLWANDNTVLTKVSNEIMYSEFYGLFTNLLRSDLP